MMVLDIAWRRLRLCIDHSTRQYTLIPMHQVHQSWPISLAKP